MSANLNTPAPAGHPPDGLDRLLMDYFKNELPHPWPEPRGPAEPSVAVRGRHDPAARSRYTLAASVGILLGLGVCLSSFRDDRTGRAGESTSPLLPKAVMDGKKILDENMNPMPGDRDPMTGASVP